MSDAWDACPELRRVDTEGRRFGYAITEAAVRSLQSARFGKLGPLQRAVLISAYSRALERYDAVLRVYPRPKTDSERKSLSRALRRLEERGPLARENPRHEHGYAYWIRLTRAGIAAAQHVEKRGAA